MGFRFQRRINLGGGWGLNTSGSGGSLSHRSRHGSIGSRGFSLRTGIPGLSYRQSWGKRWGAGVAIALALAALAVLAVNLLLVLVPLLWQCIVWIVLTLYDFARYATNAFVQWKSRQP